MKKDYFDQPIKFHLLLFRRLLAFQKSKKVGLDGIVISLLEKILPKTEGAETPVEDDFYVKSSGPESEYVCRIVKIPPALMARLAEYNRTRHVTVEDLINPVLEKGLPALSSPEENEPIPIFPVEFSDNDKTSAGVLLERQFSCPFDKTVFSAPGLKSKALNSQIDNFYLTEYTGTIGDRPFVNYSIFEIKICPCCLYTNYDKGFRIYDSINKNWQEPKFLAITENRKAAMKETIGRRYREAILAGTEGHRLFSARRTIEDAVVAVSLATDSVETLLTDAQANEKAGLLYTKGLLHIQKSRFLHNLEKAGKDAAQNRQRRVESLREAMNAFAGVESSMLQDKSFQGAHEILLYHFQKMVVAELIGDKNLFEASRTVIRKLYGDYCLGMGKGTPAEKKAATLFFNAIDEGSRKYDPSLSLV